MSVYSLLFLAGILGDLIELTLATPVSSNMPIAVDRRSLKREREQLIECDTQVRGMSAECNTQVLMLHCILCLYTVHTVYKHKIGCDPL